MRPTPEICRHKAILTHWSDYPEGSVERAKSIGLEIWDTSKRLDTTIELWESELRILRREKPWKVLGIKSADEFVKAVVGKSPKEIGKEISKRAQIKNLRDENPDWTQQQIADEVGCSRQYVTEVEASKNCDSQKKVAADQFKSDRDRADFRKLPSELQEQVREREISLNAAAIQAGVRKKKSPEDLCVANFRKAESRLSPLKVIVGELDDYERNVVRSWLDE